MRTRFFDLPLRFQIIIPLSLFIVAMTGLAVGIGLPLAGRAASENVDLKLDNSRSLFLLLLDHEATEVQRPLVSLAQKPELAAALAADDRRGLSEILVGTEPSSTDALQVTSVKGETLAAAGGHAPLQADVLDRVGLLGTDDRDWTIAPSLVGHMLVVTTRIGPEESPLGFVVAGRQLSRLLPALSSGVGADLAIYQDDQLAASTLVSNQGQHSSLAALLPEVAAASEPIKKGSVVDGRPYAAIYDRLPVGDDAEILFAVLLPKSQVWTTERLMAAGVAAAVVIPLVLLVLGFTIARAIASRLERVVGAIEGIGGGDLEQRVDLDSADEVGRLAQVVNRMGTRLQEAEASKAEFLAMVSHELRTPLALMHNATELLLDGAGQQGELSEQELLQIVAGNIDRVNRRVGDLLDLARVEAGHLSLRKGPLELEWLLVDATEGVQPMLAAKEQSLSLDLPPGLPEVSGDPDRIQQVLLNLLTNASRHTPPGTHITVRAMHNADAVAVEVEDDGPGMPEADVESLLNGRQRPFARGSTGLGLRISQRLVALHGGRLWAKSEPGRGSLFAFSLPCAPENRR
jgi:signal transduction histidine kinase